MSGRLFAFMLVLALGLHALLTQAAGMTASQATAAAVLTTAVIGGRLYGRWPAVEPDPGPADPPWPPIG